MKVAATYNNLSLFIRHEDFFFIEGHFCLQTRSNIGQAGLQSERCLCVENQPGFEDRESRKTGKQTDIFIVFYLKMQKGRSSILTYFKIDG